MMVATTANQQRSDLIRRPYPFKSVLSAIPVSHSIDPQRLH
jgi:hypothetical protein